MKKILSFIFFAAPIFCATKLQAQTNTATGEGALFSNTTGTYNSAHGYFALQDNTEGYYNTANGAFALSHNTTGSWNTANGGGALSYNTTGFENTANGINTLYWNTTGNYNTANGSNALFWNTTGYENTANGYQALWSNTTGHNNTANGSYALHSNTTSSSNTANGAYSLYSNTTGFYNTAHGYYSLYSNTTGVWNTANGVFALLNNTTGNNNTANGVNALYSNTTGGENTANGSNALFKNTTGYCNTANGADALYSNSTSSHLVAVGDSALYFLNGGVGHCTALGSKAGVNSTTGANNTFIGYHAGIKVKTGNSNTLVGYGADNNAGGYNNSTALGNQTKCSASNQVRIGNSNVTSIGGYANWSNISDGRYKKNIKADVKGLAFINKLKPITYTLDVAGINTMLSGKENDATDEDKQAINEKEKIRYNGFLAQDVEKAAKEVNYDFSGVDAPKNEKDLYGLRYSDFVVPLVKAVQELSKENDDKDAKINDLEARLAKIEALLSNQNSSVIENSKLQTASPSSASLDQNIPNPFNHTTKIGYSLPQKCSAAQIVITDNSGKTLKQINISGIGKGSVNIGSSTLAADAYYYALYVDGRLIDTKQMIISK